jgi:hypothetical protein
MFAGTGMRDPVTTTSASGGWDSAGAEGDCADAVAHAPTATATLIATRRVDLVATDLPGSSVTAVTPRRIAIVFDVTHYA